MRRLLPLLALLSLAACQTTQSSDPSLAGLPTPPARAETAPAVARQELQAEPAPPAGVGAAALRRALETSTDAATAEALYKWIVVDMPEWGREGWRRAEEMSKELLRREAETTKPLPR